MPGESPGRDWDALLTEEPTVEEALAAARARHRRKQRARMWSIFGTVVIGLVFAGWCVMVWAVLGMPHILLVPAFIALPLMLWATYLIGRRLERVFMPSTERELGLEE